MRLCEQVLLTHLRLYYRLDHQRIRSADAVCCIIPGFRGLRKTVLTTCRRPNHQNCSLTVNRYMRNIDPSGLITERKIEMPSSRLELRIVIMVRSNYAPWVRSDHTGFEVMLGDMTTFSAPEQTAASARAFFSS